VQLPDPSQMSDVHGLPSSEHALPLLALPIVQPPLPSHVELAWQSPGVQVYPVPPHVPLVHTSLLVHAFPSLHVVPFGAAGFEHWPVLVLHVPATWHWSDAEQRIGFEPVHVPLWHVSVCVHAFPSLQAVPSATYDQAVVDALGVQTWHALAGLKVPEV
jgi:hypothetical protein